MLTTMIRRSTPLLVAGALCACVPVTVNVNFPQEKIEGAADNIEDMVRSPENPKPGTQPKPKPQSRLGDSLLAALAPREASAQVSQVDVMPRIQTRTPELMKAIESRRTRRPEIDQWKAKGCIGESSQGLVEARPDPACPPEVAKLIGAENADREFIIQTLMQQNKIPPSDAPRVRAAFAKARQERAHPGEWIQRPDGAWAKK
jgi:uncharacterized protein YdbL (DUF1318 family)